MTRVTHDTEVVVVVAAPRIASRNDVVDVEGSHTDVTTYLAEFFL
jgi:hypothetical protein